MKSVHFVSYEYPPVPGGIARAMYNVQRACSARGFGERITTADSGITGPRGLANHLLRAARVRARPDEIIVAGKWTSDAVPLAVSPFQRSPFVVFVHGTELLMARRSPIRRALLRRVLHRASGFVAVSKYTSDLLERTLGASIRVPRLVFSSLVDTEPLLNYTRPTTLAAMIPELDEESQLLLTIARMVPRKGHLRALGAFAAVAGEFPNAHWAFTGTGALRSTILEEAARLGVQDRVHGLGWVAEEQLCSLLSRSDVMLGLGEETDDDVEGLGLCFIEAGCTGTPSLVTRTGGVSEVVIDGETGILVEQGETDTIPQRLAHLLSDRAYRRRLGENARKLAREKFDAYRNIDRLIDFLTECYLSG